MFLKHESDVSVSKIWDVYKFLLSLNNSSNVMHYSEPAVLASSTAGLWFFASYTFPVD